MRKMYFNVGLFLGRKNPLTLPKHSVTILNSSKLNIQCKGMRCRMDEVNLEEKGV